MRDTRQIVRESTKMGELLNPDVEEQKPTEVTEMDD